MGSGSPEHWGQAGSSGARCKPSIPTTSRGSQLHPAAFPGLLRLFFSIELLQKVPGPQRSIRPVGCGSY